MQNIQKDLVSVHFGLNTGWVFLYFFYTFPVEAYCRAFCFVPEKSVAQTRKPQCSETGRLRGSCIRRSPPTSYP